MDEQKIGTTKDYHEDLIVFDQYMTEHEAEIAAAADKPFELTDGTSDEIAATGIRAVSSSQAAVATAPAVAAPSVEAPAAAVAEPSVESGSPAEAASPAIPAAAATPATAAAPAATPAAAAPAPAKEESGRESILQKIAKLKVGDRVKLAMLGNKEERSVLIRDGSKVVSSAVLASPKLTDSEVETIAGMKNVQQSVLRDIQRSRKFMKNYNVVKNLINNPRCPLDISLTMVKNLQVNDLKQLSMNKNVPETLKKVALKNFKEKSGPAK
jgi:hypothetical protein